MKMNNYRPVLLGFVTVSLVFLTGFEKPGANDAPSPSELNNIKGARINSKDGPVDSKQKKIKNKHSIPSAENDATEDAELQKSLNLSIPFKDSENTWMKTEQSRAAPGESSNMFATEKKPRPVDLDGQILMSQDPEMDKRKSLDGAGIVINLKR